jgi:hypothetical protein
VANSFLTTSLITREILSVLRQKLTFIKKINMEYKDEFAVTGAKIGDTVNIRVPTRGEVREGRIMNASALNDRTTPLTITDQTGVDLVWNSSDMALKIDDFRARYLDQRIADMASRIESRVISRALPYASGFVSNSDGKLAIGDGLLANKALTDSLAPEKRYMMTNTSGTVQAVQSAQALFNAQNQIKNQYEEGIMARAMGFDWFESTNMPTQAAGTAAFGTAAGYLVNGVGLSGSSIAIDTGTGTIKAGQHVTFPNVFSVNGATKESTGFLQTFVVTADYAGGAGNLQILPAITLTGPEQNVTALPTNNDAMTILGAANQSGVNLGFTRDFLTFATVDLPLPENKDASRMVFDGLSLRMIRDYDTINDQFLNRIDVLWGSAVLRPEFGVVVPNNITDFS